MIFFAFREGFAEKIESKFATIFSYAILSACELSDVRRGTAIRKRSEMNRKWKKEAKK